MEKGEIVTGYTYLAKKFRKRINALHTDAMAMGATEKQLQEMSKYISRPFKADIYDNIYEIKIDEISDKHYKVDGNWIQKNEIIWDEWTDLDKDSPDQGYIIVEILLKSEE